MTYTGLTGYQRSLLLVVAGDPGIHRADARRHAGVPARTLGSLITRRLVLVDADGGLYLTTAGEAAMA